MTRRRTLARLANWIPWALLAAGFGLMVWRSFVSFCWSDESFYLAAAHRFWLGQDPFLDEWNTAQLYVVLLMPFYSLYRAVFDSADGVYLAARLVYALASSLVSAFLYATLRRESRAGALCGALLFLFYSRANIGGLSYYNLSLLFALVGATALYRAAGVLGAGRAPHPSHAPRAEDPAGETFGAAGFGPAGQTGRTGRSLAGWGVLAGGSMALSVVCCPFFALLWLALLLALLPRFARFRPLAFWLLVGTAASAGCYLAWLLPRVSFSQLFEMLPYLLNDPEAVPLTPLTLLMAFALPVYQFRYTLPLWSGALAWILWRLWARRGSHGPAFSPREALLPAGLTLAALAANLALCGRSLGKPHAALCLAALALFLLLPDERRPWRVFWCFGLPGGVLAVCWQLASNTRFSGMTIGFALAAVWAAVTAARFAEWWRETLPAALAPAAPASAGPAAPVPAAENGAGEAAVSSPPAPPAPDARTPGRRAARALPVLCLALGLAAPVLVAGAQRVLLVYRDDPIALCDTRIEQGPARGLYTSAQNARQYEEVCATLAALPEDAGPVYLSSLLPWGYLVNDLPCGAPGVWRIPLDHRQLPDYYALRPQNFPRTVLVLRPEIGRCYSSVEGLESPAPNANVSESWFLDQLAARGYTVTEVACGWLYTAP